MRPKGTLLLAVCGAVVGALTLTPVTARALPSSDDCPTPAHLRVNRWTGPQAADQVGLWTDDDSWSLGHHPGAGSSDEIACVRTAGQVVLGRGGPVLVRVAALDLAGPGGLLVQGSSSLLLRADPTRVASRVAPDAHLEIREAVLGGRGRIEVSGHLVLSAGGHGHDKLTSRHCGRGCTSKLRERRGTISVDAGGELVVQAPVRVRDRFHVVVVGGELRMEGARGRVIADGGTRLGLRPDPSGAAQPALTFRNNGGWYTAPEHFSDRATRVAIHGGVVEKTDSQGTSTIQGKVTVSTSGLNARVESGTLAVANAPLGHTGLGGGDASSVSVVTDLAGGATYSTGTCGAHKNDCHPVASLGDPQIASLKLPAGTSATHVTLTLNPVHKPSLGQAVVLTGDHLGPVARDDPVRLKLRYDSTQLLGIYSTGSDVAVSENGDDPFHDLADCADGQIPDDLDACVDRDPGPDGTRLQPDGDLVLAVLTTHFSRYICH